jgi:hypothetical protein
MTAREEFLRVLRGHHAIYLDAGLGFRMVRSQVEEWQRTMLRHGHPARTIEELDETELFISDEDPAEHRVEHVAKMGWLKLRNDKNGRNQRALGNLVVVSIFSFWEDHYRALVAHELGGDKNSLLVPVLGDVRLLRNDIVHHASIATARISRCQVLRWFEPGQVIQLDEARIDTMVVEIRRAIKSLSVAPVG